MPFPFSHVCQLLNDLETLRIPARQLGNQHSKPIDVASCSKRIVEAWFAAHRPQINNPAFTDAVALLSTLLPERCRDRVYALREARLLRLLPRALHLSVSRTRAVNAFLQPGNGDLATCLETVLKEFDGEPKPRVSEESGEISVEYVDSVLGELAARIEFSAPEVRVEREDNAEKSADELLRPLVLRLKSWEVKWLTRLILKDFAPVILNENLVLSQFHFLLPDLLKFQDHFGAAISLLKGPLRKYPAQPDIESQKIFKAEAASLLRPKVGIRVGRPPYFKARSLEHCLKMTKKKRWTMERKYDGEYAEIHVDLDQNNPIRIFSKSGKDSTQDRIGIHETLMRALRIGKPNCGFKKQCIVLGELVVYCEQEQRILGFEHIRKHVQRNGRFIGAFLDSPIRPSEHLMIVFFDVLLIDDLITMIMTHETRRKHLKRLVKKELGYAITSDWKIHDFSGPESGKVLAYQFVDAVAKRTEGLVLKPADSRYYSFASTEDEAYLGYFIKVKLDYLGDMGDERDVVDLAVVGASYDARTALKLGQPNLKFTTFYLGCLINRSMIRFGHSPLFEVVAVVGAEHCIPRSELLLLNNFAIFNGIPVDGNDAPTVNLHPKLMTCFADPLVVEVLGSGYTKLANKDFFTLRHPRILRLHLDRSWNDVPDMDELQVLAQKGLRTPLQGESQEMTRLLDQIKRKYAAKNGFIGESISSFATPRKSTASAETSPSHNDKHISPLRVFSSFPLQPVSPNRVARSHSQSDGQENVIIHDHSQPRQRTISSSPHSHKPTKVMAAACSPNSSKMVPICRNLKRSRDVSSTTAAVLSPPLTKRQKLKTSDQIPTSVLAETNKATPYLPLRKAVVLLLVRHLSRINLSERVYALGGIVADNPSDWVRQTAALQYPIEIIPESQSYPGLVKVALVDGTQEQDWQEAVSKALENVMECVLVVNMDILDYLETLQDQSCKNWQVSLRFLLCKREADGRFTSYTLENPLPPEWRELWEV